MGTIKLILSMFSLCAFMNLKSSKVTANRLLEHRAHQWIVFFASFRKRSWNQWHHIRSHHRVILVCKNHAFGFLTELFKDFKNSSMGALWNEVPLLSSCSLLLCFLVELSSFRLTRWIGDSWLGDREWLIDEIEVVELLPLSKKT